MDYSEALYGPYTAPNGKVLVSTPVTLGDLTFGAVDEYGCVWLMDTFDGWDSPASSTAVSQRTHQHGAWATTPYYEHREITMSGTCRVPDAMAGVLAKDRLFEAVSLNDVPFIVDEHGLTRTTLVRRQGPVLWKYRGHAYEADWSISLVALDPTKYGLATYSETLRLPTTSGGLQLPFTLPFSIDAVVTTNVATISNAGNASTYPVYRIDGPVSNPMFVETNTGRRMQFTITFGAGRYIEVDTGKHTVTLDGQTQRQHVMSGDWLDLPPGQQEIMFLADDANPNALTTIRWRDAWQ